MKRSRRFLLLLLLLTGWALAGGLKPVLSYNSSPVNPGEKAKITVKTLPGARCTIELKLKSGQLSKAKGLEPKIAGKDGKVRWSWTVGGRTSPGKYPITVRAVLGDQKTATRTTLVVEKK